jgi:hypothetical protein
MWHVVDKRNNMSTLFFFSVSSNRQHGHDRPNNSNLEMWNLKRLLGRAFIGYMLKMTRQIYDVQSWATDKA